MARLGQSVSHGSVVTVALEICSDFCFLVGVSCASTEAVV